MRIYKRIFKEGKQQAIQLFIKNGWENHEAKYVIDRLIDYDPTTPQNKYLELFAKIVLSYKNSKLIGYETFSSDFEKNELYSKLADIEKRNLKLDIKKIADIKSFVNEVDSTTSVITQSKAKQGMPGLKKGTDYIEIPTNNDLVKAYIPLNYKASKVIASDKVRGCEGKWCTAYQKTDDYWNEYIEYNRGILVYVINYDPGIDFIDFKQAIYFYPDKSTIEMFDARDSRINSVVYKKNITIFVYANWDKIRKAYNLIEFEEPKIMYYFFHVPRGLEASSTPLNDIYKLRSAFPLKRRLENLFFEDTITQPPIDIMFRSEDKFKKEFKDKETPVLLALKISVDSLKESGYTFAFENEDEYNNSSRYWKEGYYKVGYEPDEATSILRKVKDYTLAYVVNKRYEEDYKKFKIEQKIKSSITTVYV